MLYTDSYIGFSLFIESVREVEFFRGQAKPQTANNNLQINLSKIELINSYAA